MIEIIEQDADGWSAVGPGLTAVVERAAAAALGRVEGEVVVKRYELIGQRPYLCSGNALYPPVAIVDLECQVWGVVRSVIHEYAV